MGIILLGNKQVLLLLIYTGSAVSPLRTALTFRAFTIWSTFTSNFIVAVAITWSITSCWCISAHSRIWCVICLRSSITRFIWIHCWISWCILVWSWVGGCILICIHCWIGWCILIWTWVLIWSCWIGCRFVRTWCRISWCLLLIILSITLIHSRSIRIWSIRIWFISIWFIRIWSISTWCIWSLTFNWCINCC